MKLKFKSFTTGLRVLLLVILCVLCIGARAQTSILQGTVVDNATHATLPSATVRITNTAGHQLIVTTNANGHYSTQVSNGNYTIKVSYTGYRAQQKTITLSTPGNSCNFQLEASGTLNEVVVAARPAGEHVKASQMSVTRLNAEVINKVPVLFGERDPLKVLQLTPGVKGGAEGNTGLYIRGGATDQNLILLDGATIYNPAHMGGLFSSFNADAIKDLVLYKGAMPAQFGGRLSSVIDVTTLDGNDSTLHLNGGIGLISSHVRADGPLLKHKLVYALSARRTYIDIFKPLVSDTAIKNSNLSFYDINAKVTWLAGVRTTVSASGYLGQDMVGVAGLINNKWGNKALSARLLHTFNSGLYSNTTLLYNSFDYRLKLIDPQVNFTARAIVNETGIKENLQYTINRHAFTGGAELLVHTIKPINITPGKESSLNPLQQEKRIGYEGAAYLADEFKVTDNFTITTGLRLSWFGVAGPGTFNAYNNEGTIVQATTVKAGRLYKNYWNAEPRIAAAWEFVPNNSVKVSYARNTQNIHVLTNSDTGAPSDIYALSSNNILPEVSNQAAIGYFADVLNNRYELSIEGYYKRMDHQIDYKNGAILIANPLVESQLLYGIGRAYGMELFVRKRYGRLNGWLGYTLSYTQRQIQGINNGNWYNAPQDRRHDLSLVAMYQYSPRISFNGVFAYSTGYAITYPEAKYNVAGQTAYYYAQRNAGRSPYISHLDLSATIESKNRHRLKGSWSVGAYNVLDRKNPWAIGFRTTKNKPKTTEAVQTSLFGIVPFVSWNFKL